MLCRVLVARLNLDLQHQPQISQHVAVIGVRGPPRLLRVVADHRSFLMAVERFHRRVDIKNPGLAQQRPRAIVELLLQPGPPGFRRALLSARRTASSLTTLVIPSSGGLTGSQRSVVIWA